jgi:hypothetical protein
MMDQGRVNQSNDESDRERKEAELTSSSDTAILNVEAVPCGSKTTSGQSEFDPE